MKSISILGCGWLGLSLGKYLVEEGYVVKGSTTSVEKMEKITAVGVEAFLLRVGEDLEGEEIGRFFQSEILVLNIPPRRRAGDVEQRFPQQVRQIIAGALQGEVKQVLFVSSTSVYPSRNQLVTEADEVAPETASARALVAAEQFLQNQEALESTILRLAGLVGGERHPGRWFAGKQHLSGGSVPVNLVHREDCLAAIGAIIAQKKWGEIYQLCADEHPLKKDFYPLMAANLGLEIPVFDGEEEVPYKVIGNEKIKKDLGLTLKYPNPNTFFV